MAIDGSTSTSSRTDLEYSPWWSATISGVDKIQAVEIYQCLTYNYEYCEIKLYRYHMEVGECPVTSFSGTFSCDQVKADMIKVMGSKYYQDSLELYEIKVKGYSKTTISIGNMYNSTH